MYVDPSIATKIGALQTSLQGSNSGGVSWDKFSTNVGNKFTTLKNAIGGGIKSASLNPAVLSATGGLSAAIPAGMAVGKFIAGKIKQNKADASMPRMEDPEERALASYASRRKRAFQTGTASVSTRNALLSSMKTGINKSFQVGGGSKGLNMMSNMFNQAMLGIQDRDLAGELQYSQAEADRKTRLSQRELELGLLKYNTEQARAAQTLKEGKSIGGVVLAKSLGLPDANPYGYGSSDNIVAKNEE